MSRAAVPNHNNTDHVPRTYGDRSIQASMLNQNNVCVPRELGVQNIRAQIVLMIEVQAKAHCKKNNILFRSFEAAQFLLSGPSTFNRAQRTLLEGITGDVKP